MVQDQLINNTVNSKKKAQGFYLVVGLSVRSRIEKEAWWGKRKRSQNNHREKENNKYKVQYQRE